MVTVEERLAKVEAHVEEHSQQFVLMREALSSLERRMESRFDMVERRFETMDGRFDKMSNQISTLILIVVTAIVGFAAALIARA